MMKEAPGKPPSAPPADPRWAWHHRTLLAARRRLRGELSERAREAGLPRGSGDEADRTGETLDQEVALALAGGEERMLFEIEDALRRIERGTYGLCEATGRPIPAARLGAVPWCRYVAEVEAAHERLRQPDSKPYA